MISALTVSRYRCFRREQRVELGRLNLFYGDNGSGKSSLLRVLPLIDHSIAPGLPLGFNPSSPVLRGASRASLACQLPQPDEREDPRPTLEVEGVLGDWRRLRWVFEGLSAGKPALDLRLEEVEVEDSQGAVTRLRRERGPRGQEAGVVFRLADGQVVACEAAGLWVSPHGGQVLPAMPRIPWKIFWMTAHQALPSRGGALPTEVPWREDGSAAEALMVAQPLRLASIGAWMEAHLGLRPVVVDFADQRKRIELLRVAPDALRRGPASGGSTSVQLPLADSADGIIQMFPILVALELAAEKGGLLILEEPEAHLHPRLQRALAERIVEMTHRHPSLQVMVETHSELFLLAALKAAIAPLGEAVSLHWVDIEGDGGAFVHKIALDALGRPTSPELERAFRVIHDERRALLDKRAASQHAG